MDAVQLLCTVCAAAVAQLVHCGRVCDGGFALDRLIGHTDKSVSECTLHLRVRACGSCWLLERAHKVAASYSMRQETDGMCVQHPSCNMQRTTSMLRPCRMWQMTRDLCHAASCSAMGAAQL
jgi:hypothetical protein